MDELQTWFKKQLPQILLIISGLSSIGYGAYQMWGQTGSGEVEVLGVGEEGVAGNGVTAQVIVDVSGAVEQPGVYQLDGGARIAQAIEKAGGFSAKADEEAVAKMINLAEVLKDGQKIFIPIKNEGKESQPETKEATATTANTLININTASKTELESLWGVGEARAQTIIDNRPYSNLEELKTKAKLPESVLEKIKTKISLF